MDGISNEIAQNLQVTQYLDSRLTELFDQLLTPQQKESLDSTDRYNAIFSRITEGINDNDLYDDTYIKIPTNKLIKHATNLIQVIQYMTAQELMTY